MRRRGLLLLICGLLPASVLLSSVRPSSAQEERSSREDELRTVRAEIGRLEDRLRRVRERERGIAGTLARIEGELELREMRLTEARAAGEMAAERAEESARGVERLGLAVERARRDLGRRVAGLYRLGRKGYLRLALSLDAEEDVLGGLRALRYLARRDARAIGSYETARKALAEEQERLAARRREVERWIAEEEARRAKLAAARARQAAILDRVAGERRALSGRTSGLADRARKLAGFLDLLQGEGGAGPAGTPIQRFRGVLDWPVDGSVTAGFGPRLDPRYRTRVPHNGLTIATRPGGEVRAVYAGEVLYAAPFQGYGPTVVVHHPGKVLSLYAGLARLAVELRDTVPLGQPLGVAADTLYFEIRSENEPQDPRSWLR